MKINEPMNQCANLPNQPVRCIFILGIAWLLIGCTANDSLSSAAPTTQSIRANIATNTPRSRGGFDAGSAWLYGTATPTVSPTITPTPGPSPTPTVSPTPVNGTTLKGQLLFISSRALPAIYTPLGNSRVINPSVFANLGNGFVVWRWDPATGKVAPCDPPPATPTPLRPGLPTPALLFGDLGALMNRTATACQSVYDQAQSDQTWSADKRFEAYVGSDPNGGRPQIFVLDHQTQTKKMVTRFGSGVAYDPAFAPDGYHLVFVSQELGQDNLYTVTRDGTELRQLTRIPGQDWPTTWEWIKRPTWSADGTQIAFWSNRVSGARQVWVMQTDGSLLRSISNDPRPAEDYDPVWVH